MALFSVFDKITSPLSPCPATSFDRNRLQNLQQEVEQTKSTLRENLAKVVTRAEKLDDLSEKAELLEAKALAFRKATRKLPARYRPEIDDLDDKIIGLNECMEEEALASLASSASSSSSSYLVGDTMEGLLSESDLEEKVRN